MTKIQQSLTINAPLEAITAYASDPCHMPVWNQMIARVWDVQAAPEVVGTTWQVAVKVMGSEQHVVARISSYEAPRRFGIELVGGAPGMPGLQATLEMEVKPARSAAPGSSHPASREAAPSAAAPDSGSAQVVCTLHLRVPLRVGGSALGALISPVISEQLRHGLLDLKRVLEAHQRGTGG
jgi:uncharacterized membrane protein